MLHLRKSNVTVKLFTQLIQTYHKKPYLNVGKVMLLDGNWYNVVVHQYKETG